MLKKLKQFFTSSGSSSSGNGFFLKARCGKCEEEFNLYIDKTASLAQNYDESSKGGYFLNKEIIGARCPNRMQVRMDFDNNRKLRSRTIENGEFIED